MVFVANEVLTAAELNDLSVTTVTTTGTITAGTGGFVGNASSATLAATATKLAAAKTIDITGVTATATAFDGSANISIPVTAVPSSLLTGTILNARIPTTITGKTSIESNYFEADVDGTSTAPAFTWDSDPSMGLYRAAADCLAVGLNGETAFIATESTNTNGGSIGNGYVGISDYCGGVVGGSVTRLITQDIEGIQVKRLAFDSSSREFKSDEAAWALTDEQFMSIQPTAFTPNGQYVHEGVHYMIGTDGNGAPIVPPEGSLPIRRAGMIQEDVALVDLHLISEAAIDWNAISTATLEKVQRLMERVEALEAA